MNPRQIEVHIEDLVLHGFDPGERWSLSDAIESALVARLRESGVPSSWLSEPTLLKAALPKSSGLTNAKHYGRAVGEAICKGVAS